MIKIFLITVCLVGIVIFLYFTILSRLSQKQLGPSYFGEKLQDCSSKRNCICTEYLENGSHVEPAIVLLNKDNPNVLSQIKEVILNMGGSINQQSDNYLSSTFRSKLFGFVDDFEIRIDEVNGKIHIRSASRVGRSDFGANKKRIVRFKQELAAKMKQ